MVAKVTVPRSGAVVGFIGVLMVYLGLFAPWLTIFSSSVIPASASGWGTIQALFSTLLQGPYGTGQDSFAWWLLLCLLALLLISLFPAGAALKARFRSTHELARVYRITAFAGLFILLLLLCSYPALIPRFGVLVVVMPLFLILVSPAFVVVLFGMVMILIGGSIAARS